MPVKTKSTALTPWDAKLSALAKASAATQAGVGGVGNFVSIRGGILTYQSASVKDNKMRCIIIDAVLENQYFDTDFDPDNPTSPDCYALGRDMHELAPDPEKVPEVQNSTCNGCPQMQFGSAKRGKGKACHACQRLAIIAEGDLDDALRAEVAYLKLPFFSTLEYAAYSRQLTEVLHKPPLAFITEISVVPDPKSQFRVKFNMAEEIEADPATYEALWKKYEIVSKEIMFAYPKRETDAAASHNGSKGKPKASAKRKF